MKNKRGWQVMAGALLLALWCGALALAQRQSDALGSVAVRWPGGGVSPAQLEAQMELFREDGVKTALPEVTLWGELADQRVQQGDSEITCEVLQSYGHGEDLVPGELGGGSLPLRGQAGDCALSSQAAFALFGSAGALGQTLLWEDRSYVVQGIFEDTAAVLLVQLPQDSQLQLPNMQLRFAGGGTRQQAEEFLARTPFGSGARLLDMPLIGWGLRAAAQLPALLLGLWALVRVIAQAWRKRRLPRALLGDLPWLLPLTAAGVYLLSRLEPLPKALIPSELSDVSFWTALPKGWSENITAWLRQPSGRDIQLVFAVMGLGLLTALALLAALWLLAGLGLGRREVPHEAETA